jgi:hypothetical protein
MLKRKLKVAVDTNREGKRQNKGKRRGGGMRQKWSAIIIIYNVANIIYVR